MSRWRGNPWAVLLTLSLGFFMTLLDLTAVNVAIPSMIGDLHASLDEVLWVINVYILVLAALLITFGRLGDVRGPRTMFIGGVALFTVASVLCGLSQDPAQLIATRAVQGLGAAALMPQTMTIIIGTFPAERRGAALGVWGGVAGVATIAGPTLGGFLVSTALLAVDLLRQRPDRRDRPGDGRYARARHPARRAPKAGHCGCRTRRGDTGMPGLRAHRGPAI